MLKSVKIRRKKLAIPIIQGGMGIGVSLERLAGAVMFNGGMGVLSAAQPGYREPDFWENTQEANQRALKDAIDKAREYSKGNGLLGVNIMVAMNHYADYVKTAVDAGADAIISGAGLPMDLPKYVGEADIALAPIVSSGRAARLILKAWDRHYSRKADFIVIEGSEAGGHLGFKESDLLEGTCQNLEEILEDVKKETAVYEEKYHTQIPVFVAGGIYDGNDIAKFLKAGADGVQMATRFIATDECDADQVFKNTIIHARKEDIEIVKSPAGFPGRAIRTALIEKVKKNERVAPQKCLNCLKTCDPKVCPYCISKALIEGVKGNMEEGLFFCGAKAYKIEEIVPVKTLIDTLVGETEKLMEE